MAARVGVTSYLRIYNSDQFEAVSRNLTALYAGAMTVAMIFFAPQMATIAKHPSKLRHLKVSGVMGLIYFCLAFVDSVVRPRIPGLRLFGELSLASGYCCIWIMVFAVFKDYATPCIVSCTILSVAVLVSIAAMHPKSPLGVQSVDPRLAAVILGARVENDPFAALHVATILAILVKPESPETKLLCNAVKEVAEEVAKRRAATP